MPPSPVKLLVHQDEPAESLYCFCNWRMHILFRNFIMLMHYGLDDSVRDGPAWGSQPIS
ncbi:MAG: hypothetical protein WCF84_06195 [Anaerolineae bacterium]